MQLSHEDISDLKRIVLDEDTDPFNLIRAFLFQFINNHSDLSIKSVVFKPNPAEETSANASSSTSVAGLDEDELLNGPHGNYQNVFAQDYLAFLVTQPADWFTALPHLESLGMNQAQLLDKAKRLSDYGVTKARITGGKSRNPLDQFKFNCLEYCSSYYADLDQKGELSSTNPLGKKRRLAICISKLTELTYTLALFNCHFRTLLE